MKITLTEHTQQEHHDNPAGLDGFHFLEFSSPDVAAVEVYFKHMGFTPVAKHRFRNITLYQQGQIQFWINQEPNTQAAEHAKIHGPGACAMGFHTHDAQHAYQHAIKNGAEPFEYVAAEGEVRLPAIKAIGGSVIYFVDKTMDIEKHNFTSLNNQSQNLKGAGLVRIDHLTHNVFRGDMEKWTDFYKRLFNFFQIRFFDIRGKQTGLISHALSSPCGKIKIPLNEGTEEKSQIEEFLREYHGEGIQHIALSSENIYETVETLKEHHIPFLDVPDTYYEMLPERVDWHHEDMVRLQKNKILLDGDVTPEGGLLLQIFTENALGPAFFEIIQRKGNDGFGEGNFKALFEAIERDQIRRGVL
jgi:4-hydroxyphenylpyruvate dioxygenase